MIPRIAIAVFLGLSLAAGGVQAACPRDQGKPVAAKPSTENTAKQRTGTANCVDFGAVPQISAHIVAAEVAGQPVPAKTPAYTPPVPTPYQGPTIGLTKPEPGVRPAPTVGYHWSLD
jgi:hypothetical protein